MSDAYRNRFTTDAGYTIEKEPVVAVAVVQNLMPDRKDMGGYVTAEPIVMSTTIRDDPFELAGDLAQNETVVSAVPVQGIYKVLWVAEESEKYDITELGYEVEGATNLNWDWVIESQIKDGEDD